MNESDERKGLPSASALEAIALCPGRFLAEQLSPNDIQTKDANDGQLIHAALETGNRSNLTEDQADSAERCAALRASLVDEFIASVGGEHRNSFKEQRIWLYKDGAPIASGKPDEVFACGDALLIMDYKTGRNEVSLAPNNIQLRALAVMAAELLSANFVRVAIIQPWVSPQISVCDYELNDIVAAGIQIRQIISAAKAEGAPRIPGEQQCKYCRAKATCPEAGATVNTLARQTFEGWDAWAPSYKAKLFDACVVAERVIDQIRARIKTDLETDPESIPGLRLKDGAKRRSVGDAQKAFSKLSGALDAQTFASCCTVKIAALETAFRKATGLKTKEAKKQFETLLDGVIETKRAASSVERVEVA